MNSCSSLISKLKTLIDEDGDKDRMEAYEDAIEEEIEKYVKVESFYKLPTNKILKIFGKGEIRDTELLCEFISRMCEKKGEESILLLNDIKREEATLEECIKILSKFEHSQICKQTSRLFIEDKEMPERDYENEIRKTQERNRRTS